MVERTRSLFLLSLWSYDLMTYTLIAAFRIYYGQCLNSTEAVEEFANSERRGTAAQFIYKREKLFKNLTRCKSILLIYRFLKL